METSKTGDRFRPLQSGVERVAVILAQGNFVDCSQGFGCLALSDCKVRKVLAKNAGLGLAGEGGFIHSSSGYERNSKTLYSGCNKKICKKRANKKALLGRAISGWLDRD